MSRSIAQFFSERNVFWTVLAVNILLLLTVKFYPSMDGPSHLYNANLLVHLVKGDSAIINQCFVLNHVFIPNWLTPVVLGFFTWLLPAWCAEKLLLITYIIGISVSFRLLVKTINPANPALSICIFPFSYSFLFHLGFYNYCFSFILLFFTLYWWLTKNKEGGVYFHLILCALLTLTYFAGIITFAFLGLCLGLWIVAEAIRLRLKNRARSISTINLWRKLSLLAMASLPGLVLGAIFMMTSTFSPSKEHYSFDELIKWLNDVRPLIVYNYLGEAKITSCFLHCFVAIVAISLFIRFYNIKGFFYQKVRKEDVLLFPALIALTLLFVIPNGANAGMMSDRYCLMAFMLLIVWVSTQPLPKEVSTFFVFIILTLHFGLLLMHDYSTVRNLNKHTTAISNASSYVDSGTIILPVNLSDDWLELHFSNYIGADKSIIVLENYEASIGWFPVKWNTAKIPCLQLGGLDNLPGLGWPSNHETSTIRQIEYVLLYGNTDRINELAQQPVKQVLQRAYRLIYTSGDRYVALYKKK